MKNKKNIASLMEHILLLAATVILFVLMHLYATAVYAAKQTFDPEKWENPVYEQATFAAGCFWCVESEFEAIKGVVDVVSGYTGGHVKDPSYQQVSGHDTGHAEAVRILYDPAVISYQKLLEAFWNIHDPTQVGGQGVDQGPQYRSVIFYHTDTQKELAEAARKTVTASAKFKKSITTAIEPASEFYPAEDYHQDYNTKRGVTYKSVFEQGGESTTMKKRRFWGLFE